MTDVNHSQVLVGSRHAIHNLTYPNAANRIAGTNEGRGIVPLTINNLWQIAKQDDDDSLWMCVDTAPLTWDQIMTGTSGNLDVGYNAFGGAGTVTIDAGDLTWAPTGAYSFVLDLSATSGGNGFRINSGGGYFLDIQGNASNLYYEYSGNTFEAAAGFIEFTAGDFVVNSSIVINLYASDDIEIISTGASNDLLLGARTGSIYLNESGQESLAGAFTAVSLVGGLNEVMGGGLGVFTGAVSITKAGTVKTNADFLSLTNTANAVDMDGTSTGVLWNQWYYDGVTPAIADAGRIAVGTEQDWTSTASTQDSYMAFETALDGTVSEKVRITSAGVLKVGGATPSYATGAGDLFATGDIEADSIFSTSGIKIATSQIIEHTSQNSTLPSILLANGTQSPSTGQLLTGTNANSWIICEAGDKNYNFAHALQTTPTLFFQSDAQSATEWGSITHDGDYFRLNTGAGSVCIGTGTPAVATGLGDLYVTDQLEAAGALFALGGLFASNGAEAAPSISFSADSDTGFWRFGSNDIRLSTGAVTHSVFNSGGLTVNTGVIAAPSGAVGAPGYAFSSDLDTGIWLNGAADMRVTLAGVQHIVINSGGMTLQSGDLTVPYGSAADPGYAFDGDSDTGLFRKAANSLGFATAGVERLAINATGEIEIADAGKVVYDIAPASDLTATGDITSSTVDSNATGIGAALYQAADGNWDEADASALVTMPCRALAIEAGTGTKKILRRGWIRDDSWSWTPGGPVYVSTTTGALTQTKPSATGNQVQIVGYAETADILDFNPASFILEVA